MPTGSDPSSETILLAEDHESVRQLLTKILHRQGYTVLSVDRGTEALRLWERHEGPIHLLLTDVQMPEMGGPELVRHIRAQRPTIPVIYMSANPCPALLSALESESKTALLLKPFTPEILTRTVRALLAMGD
ncbi:MAG: response regulator [Nitrospirota bacterium]